MENSDESYNHFRDGFDKSVKELLIWIYYANDIKSVYNEFKKKINNIKMLTELLDLVSVLKKRGRTAKN
jgi:hypothetical protein